MTYNEIKTSNYNLYVTRNKKFKTIDVRLVFYSLLKKEDITFRNCLTDILTYSTNDYPTRRLLALKCQDLYTAYISADNRRLGNYLTTTFYLSILNPKYTEKGMLEQSIDLLLKIIFDPKVTNNRFNDKALEYIKNSSKVEFDTVKEDAQLYSNVRLFESMTKKNNYRYHGYCYLEDLDRVTTSSLYEFYKSFFKQNRLEVIATGDVDINELNDILSNKLSHYQQIEISDKFVITHDDLHNPPLKIEESSVFKQSKLAIGCKIHNLNEYEYGFVSNMYSMILGGLANSLLMQTVREDKSLAYYIYTNISKSDNLMGIYSGIDAKNYNEVVITVKQQLEEMKKGTFSEELLDECKQNFVAAIDSALENPSGILDLLLGIILFHTKLPQIRKKMMLKVTKKDVMDMATKVSMDTIYLLKGE